MNKRIFASAIFLAFVFTAFSEIWEADAWRKHRYDLFREMPVDSTSIVFMGNSITNMNEWRECFGNDQRILNRGASSAHSKEMLEILPAILEGGPAKIFLCIGTNDLFYGFTPEQIAANISDFIDTTRAKSPRTEVYVQSILPSNNGAARGRSVENIAATNELLKAVCRDKTVVYIDLFNDLMPLLTDREISLDNLHLTARGYKIWCDKIAPYVGVECSYTDDFTQSTSGMRYAYGMRSTTWSAERIGRDDVVLIGDELINTAEWNELLDTPKALKRGIYWGFNGFPVKQWKQNVATILGENPELKQAPRAIVLNIGIGDLLHSENVEQIFEDYRGVVDTLRSYAPEESTKLVVMSVAPVENDTINERIEEFNHRLQALASQLGNAEFLNLRNIVGDETSISSEMMVADMLTPKAYRAVAAELKKLLGL